MMQIDNQLISDLLAEAATCERKRMNYDLRTSVEDNSQRMLNAMLPGTVVSIHRHPNSTETVMCLCGKLMEVFYEEDISDVGTSEDHGKQVVSGDRRFKESDRYILDPANGNFGCVVPVGVWHSVEVLEPSVIFEAKDGKYGEDGSESL